MVEKTLSILLVEDNIAHVELISRSLEDSDLNVKLHVCENVSDACDFIESNTPNMIIADLNLPDGKGTELISTDGDDIKYPVILMTSFGDESIAVEAIKLGALDYFVKTPDVFSRIDRVIERVLREWNNIEARQKSQIELLKKEHEQREILSSIMDAVITIDEESTILTFNRVAEKLFNYSADEIIGTSLLRLIPESYQDTHKKGIKRYLQTGAAKVIDLVGGIELEAVRKDKIIFPIRLSIAELPASKEGLRRFIGICKDLTKLKQQEEQSMRSQKMEAMGKLTGGIAHDYNNMLGVVLGYAELLQSMLGDKPELIKYVNEIMHAGERGAKLTKKLLSFSRQSISDLTVLNLNDVLKNLQDMLEKTLTARINLVFDLVDERCMVNIDNFEFEEAIVNMSINAMHAIDGNGSLTFQTRSEKLYEKDAKVLQLEAGDYISRDIGRFSIIMVRDKDEKISVLINRCQHRGNMLCNEASGNKRNFTCPYHGWVYNLKGDLLDVAYPGGFTKPKEELNLESLETDSYRGFIFASFKKSGTSFDDYLGHGKQLIDRACEMSPQGKIDLKGGWLRQHFDANWKMLPENDTDGYHVNYVHQSFVMAIESQYGEFVGSEDSIKGVIRNWGNGHTEIDFSPGYVKTLDWLGSTPENPNVEAILVIPE